jgi:predicted dehydrogenase
MPAPDRPLRIGLIGCGNWGRHVLRDLMACACEVEVVAVSPDSVDNARRGNATRIIARVADLRPADAVIVVTPATTHVEVIDEILARQPRMPIYTEKPLSVDYAQAARVARDHAANVFVMHKWRYHPGVLALADIARSGELGPVLGLRVTREQWGFPRRDVDPVWTHWPHVLSIALEILGTIPTPRCARIDCAGTEITGMTATLGDAPWFVVHDSVRGLEARREVQLYCERGIARLRDSYADAIDLVHAASLEEMRAGMNVERRAVSTKLPLLAQIEAFLAFVRGLGPAPKGTAAEDASIVQAITTLRALAGADKR